MDQVGVSLAYAYSVYILSLIFTEFIVIIIAMYSLVRLIAVIYVDFYVFVRLL